jgi:hypothetical protein
MWKPSSIGHRPFPIFSAGLSLSVLDPFPSISRPMKQTIPQMATKEL